MFTKEEFQKTKGDVQGWKPPANPVTKDMFAEGKEKDFLREFPRTLGFDLTRSVLGTMYDVGDFFVDLVPYGKYMVDWKKEKEAFLKLDKQQQVNSLLWESFNAALWAVPAAAKNIWTMGAKTVKAGFGLVPKSASKFIQPIEDIVAWPESKYFTALGKTLKSRDYGLTELEAVSVERYLRGSKGALNVPAVSQEGGISKGFQKILVNSAGEGKAPKLELAEDIFEQLTPLNIRSRQMLYDYKHALFDRLKIYGADRKSGLYNDRVIGLDDAAFPKIMEKVYGKNPGSGMKLADATDEQLVAAREFLRSHDAPSLVKQVAAPSVSSLFRRIGTGMGKGEVAYGTRSKVYDVVEKAGEDTSVYRLTKLQIFDEMMVQRGFFTKSASGKIKPVADKLNRRIEKRALEFMRQFNKLDKQLGIAETIEQRAGLQATIKNLIPLKSAEDYAVRNLILTLNDFSDHLYGELASHRLARSLLVKQTNNLGKVRIEQLMNELQPKLQGILASGSDLNPVQKSTAINELLDGVKSVLAKEGQYWYTFGPESKNESLRVLQRINMNLTMVGDGAKFPSYRTTLFQGPPGFKAEIMGVLHNEEGLSAADQVATKFYSAVEKLGVRREMTLERELIKRISQQAQYMYLRPALRAAAGTARNYPPEWKKFVEHYMARKLHLPSRADRWVAGVLERTIGKVNRTLGKSEKLQSAFPNANWEGVYDAYDVVNMAKTMNDITYMAFLGAKPFSAMRNLFQPLILVPTDLGGIKDLGTLTKGYARVLSDKSLRLELRGMGVIPEEFSGEFANLSHNLLRTRGKALGIPLPRADEFKNAMMYIFSKSHIANCYVTGAAAVTKWDDALKVAGKSNLGAFMKKAGVSGRRDDLRASIEVLLRQGRWNDAKKVFVSSVVEDTQFLYTSGSTPLITQAAGGVGRTAAIFQTWWLNYGDTIGKWATTGTPEMKTARAVNFVASNWIAYELMSLMWEKDVAARTVFVGPFPSPGQLTQFPPAWGAIGQVMKTAAMAGGFMRTKDPYDERVKKQLVSTLKTSFTFLPAGLQLSQTIKRTSEEGGKGFVKSLVRWKKGNTAAWQE